MSSRLCYPTGQELSPGLFSSWLWNVGLECGSGREKGVVQWQVNGALQRRLFRKGLRVVMHHAGIDAVICLSVALTVKALDTVATASWIRQIIKGRSLTWR